MDQRLQRIVNRLGLDAPYPDAVEAETAAWQQAPGIDDPSLRDLTALPFVTIDNHDSRDLDQAMFIAPAKSGVILSYALADASYYVRAGSALFREALRRGASFYLPHVSYPMLPRALSEDLVSLNPDVDRRALVLRMTLDRDGACTRTEVVRARIRSAAKLTYPGVQRYYDGDPTLADAPFTETLELLRTIGLQRIAAARARNAVQYRRGARLDVERYNEQVSLLCNVEGARMLADASGNPAVQAVFRVHPSPPPERLSEFAALTRLVATAHGLDPRRWVWDPDAPLADYLDGLPENDRVSRAIHHQAVMTNVRSTFDITPSQHYGVAADQYARFSAPMREIVGIYTHKEALELLADGPATDDEAIRDEVVRAGNRSKALQKRLDKDVQKLALDDLFNTDVETAHKNRPWRLGTVIGVTPTRSYVALDDPDLEVKLYEHKAADLVPGTAIKLRVKWHDNKRRRWTFDVRV